VITAINTVDYFAVITVLVILRSEQWCLMILQVMVNLYSSHMDPDDWQQPQQFRPERFLDQSGNLIHRDKVIAFSLGTSVMSILTLSVCRGRII